MKSVEQRLLCLIVACLAPSIRMFTKPPPNPMKAAIRVEVNERLASMGQEERERQSNVIVDKIFHHQKYKQSNRISIFLSLPTEVNTSRIISDILARGDQVYVPQYCKGVMEMLRLLPGDLETMPVTSWGIKQHSKNAVRENALDNGGLDLVITPGAALTKEGWRLGHGGGYYDRYLSELKTRHQADSEVFKNPYILAVGFQEQLYPKVPVDAHDVRVDEVVTAEDD